MLGMTGSHSFHYALVKKTCLGQVGPRGVRTSTTPLREPAPCLHGKRALVVPSLPDRSAFIGAIELDRCRGLHSGYFPGAATGNPRSTVSPSSLVPCAALKLGDHKTQELLPGSVPRLSTGPSPSPSRAFKRDTLEGSRPLKP